MKWIIVVATSALYFAACSKPKYTGNTMETENSITAQVVDSSGKPAANFRVQLRPIWFMADTANSTTTSSTVQNLYTDKDGWIHCSNLPQGRYILEIANDTLGAIAEIDHQDTSSAQVYNAITLSPMGILQGSVTLPTGTHRAWVQLFGLDHQVVTDSVGNFTFGKLPPGVVRIRSIAYNVPSELAEDLVQIRPQFVTNVGKLSAPSIGMEDPATWQFSKSLRLDSVISSWMQPVSDPTVITLFLDSSNFPFAQAMADGRDLRIWDEQGNRLVFERVRWDSDLRKAVVRIRVGTANMDSSSRVTMLWGHPGAVDPGYAGLWDGINDSVKQELYTVLVDDFEHGSAKTALPLPIPSSNWYHMVSDTSVSVTPAAKTDLTPALQLAGDGRSGHAMHLTYKAAVVQWIMLGTALGSGPHSLATLDSIVFWVRGYGLYSVAFDKLIGRQGKAWVHGTLDTAWTRRCVRPQDFIAASDTLGGNLGWQAVRDSITNLTFFANVGTEIWIDDIRLYGINRDFLK